MYICRSLFGHSTIFVGLLVFHEGHFMFCNKEEFQVELSKNEREENKKKKRNKNKKTKVIRIKSKTKTKFT